MKTGASIQSFLHQRKSGTGYKFFWIQVVKLNFSACLMTACLFDLVCPLTYSQHELMLNTNPHAHKMSAIGVGMTTPGSWSVLPSKLWRTFEAAHADEKSRQVSLSLNPLSASQGVCGESWAIYVISISTQPSSPEVTSRVGRLYDVIPLSSKTEVFLVYVL